MNIKVTQDHIYIQLPAAMKSYTENVLNGIYSKKENAHRFPKSYHRMVEIFRAFPDLQHNETFVQVGKSLNVARQNALKLKQANAIYDDRLRPYQNQDIHYLKHLPAAGIFSDPRTGKSPLSIILIRELGTRRNLIVSPASLIYNWENEFKRWHPSMDTFVVNGTPKQREKVYNDFTNPLNKKDRVLIISKDTLKGDIEKFGLDVVQFDTCFVDEAAFLRNYKTLQSKAIYKIKVKRRYAITGTPTTKHSADVFGILKFLYPTKFGSYWQFVEQFYEIGQDFLGHMQVLGVKPNREQELKELIGFMSVQRKRKEVMEWLPDKQYINIPVEMNDKQKKLYTQMAEDFMAQLDDTIVDTSGLLPQLMRLRQLCLDPRLVGFDVIGTKTTSLLEWLDDNREPVVIMSMFTSYLKLLKPEIEKLGLKVGEINGELSNAEKNKSAQDFQNGKLDVLLCNSISAGTGFTLDRAEVIVFLDLPFNYSDLQQAEDRIIPTTKDRFHPVNVLKFNCRNTVDDRIMGILDNKKNLTEVVNEGGRQAILDLLGVK